MSNLSEHREIKRPPRDMIQRLKDFSVPELCDGAGLFHAMDYRIKPQTGREKIVGPAVTVDVPAGEGGIVADAILCLQDGDVLVVAGHGYCGCSYWGDHRSFCAKKMKAAGVVIDGAMRDLEECEEIGLPVYAKAVTCGTAGKSGIGAINVTVNCAEVTVSPGDIIAGDVNGVCVIRPDEAEGIMERALKKRELQKKVREEMERSSTVLPSLKIVQKNL